MLFLTVLSAIFLPFNNIGSKLNKTSRSVKFLCVSCVTCIAGVISWIVCAVTRQRVTLDMLPFAAIFAVLYVLGVISAYLAYEKGSLAGTSLFANSSLVIVVLFSTFAFNEEFTVLSAIGIAGTLVSLTLLSLPEKSADSEKPKFNWGWLLLCLGVLLFNSLISITAKARQMQAGGENPFAFMALCFSFTFVVSLATYLIATAKKHSLKSDLLEIKSNAPALTMQAFGNCGSNLLVTFLTSRVSASLLYPINMGGGLVLTTLCGFIFFKERPTVKNILGISLGIAAIVILNL